MTPPDTRQRLADARHIVVKIGSALLVDDESGTVHRQWLESLAQDIAAFRKRDQTITLVSSGAVALGRRYLKFGQGELRLEEKQAAAAVGMVRLAHAYQECLSPYDLNVAQVLLTLEDSEDRRRYLNARNTLMTLLNTGAVPLINENDTVATDEIRFGDNDRLAARVAAMTSADLLILLSDIDGLYTADPVHHADAKHIPVVEDITPEIEAMAGRSSSLESSGGMITKIAAAKQCMVAGCQMSIAAGGALHPLVNLAEGGRCTWFVPGANPQTARKRWISGGLQPTGSITIDDGAMTALQRGNSLLPAGVSGVEGEFQRGDAVVVRATDGAEIGRGLIAYAAEDARRIMGHKTDEIEALLGYRGRGEMIHRDDLVLN